MNGQPIQPMQGANMGAGAPQYGSTYLTVTPQGPVPTAQLPQQPAQKKVSAFTLLIAAVILGLIAVTFVGLFIWMWLQWSDLRGSVDSQIESATAIAVSENTTNLEDQFAEREKYPYNRFSAPADYGSLEFEYPRTWSVYIADDASSGKAYSAILNPGSVVAKSDVYALRVDINTASYEDSVKSYSKKVDSGDAIHSTRVVNGETADIWTVTTEVKSNGITTQQTKIILTIKIRDKVAQISTDALAYSDDFYKIIESITYNA